MIYNIAAIFIGGGIGAVFFLSGLILTNDAIISGNRLCKQVCGVENNQAMCQTKRSNWTSVGLTGRMII